ncbi:Protein kinase superfamily protein [Zea mays]|uniref:non-specific serine/threonine protein kinase n=1 Tax=Zea mays TaxID=4577 RepID=A0A1D6HBX0_MAIZE|nr:Protein kinase superfamily protein [Zea mays]
MSPPLHVSTLSCFLPSSFLPGSRLSKQPNLKAAKESRRSSGARAAHPKQAEQSKAGKQPWSSGGGARPCGRRPANAQRVNRTSTRAQQEGRGSHQPGKTAARRKQKPETEFYSVALWLTQKHLENHTQQNKHQHFILCLGIPIIIMWKRNPFGGKAHSGLDGRTIVVRSLKISVRNVIAQGGFSCVYLACDTVHPSKMYALKHIICNDSESLDLVMKEIQVMNLLKGHPNVVTLVAHDVVDMGRTKEALLVMEFCEKSLVSAMESRGSGYYEEKKVLLIFRDVCNAVFAMHGQSLPIAHSWSCGRANTVCKQLFLVLVCRIRDLKAENVLLGSDGAWKICDFGSTSTNHKCFNKPEEMGIEEDVIRKHTTPDYRAPEMWDLYRREVISEKVDIWVWFRVNELLSLELQKRLPDGPSPAVSLSSQDEGEVLEEIYLYKYVTLLIMWGRY